MVDDPSLFSRISWAMRVTALIMAFSSMMVAFGLTCPIWLLSA
jgi:hypothetical protein